jgi:hypothetical protein
MDPSSAAPTRIRPPPRRASASARTRAPPASALGDEIETRLALVVVDADGDDTARLRRLPRAPPTYAPGAEVEIPSCDRAVSPAVGGRAPSVRPRRRLCSRRLSSPRRTRTLLLSSHGDQVELASHCYLGMNPGPRRRTSGLPSTMTRANHLHAAVGPRVLGSSALAAAPLLLHGD